MEPQDPSNPNNPNYPNRNPLDQQFSQYFGQQQALPNAAAILVLGILSIVFALLFFCYLVPAIIGLVLGIIALALSSGTSKKYSEAPHLYSVSSYNNFKAGRICAIIGLTLSALVFIFILIAAIFYASVIGSLFDGMFNQY